MSFRTEAPSDWPALLRASDIATILACSVRSAQRKVAAGKCGPYLELDGTRYVRREAFLAALRELETRPSAPRRPRTVPARRRRRVT